MRTSNYLMMAILMMATVFTSCSSDDDNDGNTTPNNSIIGTWVVKTPIAGINVKTNSEANDIIVKGDIAKEYAGINDITLTFKDDKTVESINKKGEKSITSYKLESTKLTIYDGSEDDDEEEIYTVSIENGVLSMSFDCLEYYKDLDLDVIIRLGIKDPFDFEVISAGAKIDYQRKK